jgi:uncharacterized protein with HEPN domain
MKRDRVYLMDILEAARLALSYVESVARETFMNDTQCQDAVIRRIEIIGEAARRVSPQTRNAFPGIPWNEMIGMRSMMIHDYDDVDLEIVWDTVERDLPRLIELLQPLMPHDDVE